MNTKTYAMAAALSLMALVAPKSARSDSTYTYTGPQFTIFVGSASCGTVCSIDGSFTLSAPLAPGTTTLETAATLKSFDFFISTAGTPAVTNTNGAVIFPAGSFSLTTDASGQITDWLIELFRPATGDILFTCVEPTQHDCAATTNKIDVFNNVNITEEAIVRDSMGSWSVATTQIPEPSPALLLATGLLALAYAKRHKRFA